jgi:hypothetical protein
MKIFFVIVVFIANSLCGFSQHSITGLWYSQDSTRVYKIHETGNGLEAMLHYSTRNNDDTEVMVLNNVKYNVKRKKYFGAIYAVKDKMPHFVKIKLSTNGKILKLKLPRMILFPVNLRWMKCP